jgi:hypothetical protein
VARYPLLFVLTYLATVHYWGLYFSMDDEAFTVHGATRILSGDWPYRDWTTRHPPGSHLLSACYFAVFGSDQLGTRSLFALITAAIGLLVQATADRHLEGRARYLPWFLWTTTGVFDTPHLNYHWFGVLGSTAALYWTCRWAADPPDRTLAPRAAGASAAFALWCLQSNGLAAVVTLALVWLRLRPPGLLRVLQGFALGSLLLWLPLLPQAPTILQECFLGLGGHMRFAIYPYSWSVLAELPGFSPTQQFLYWSAAWSYWLLTLLRFGLFYAVIAVAVVWLEWRRARPLLPLAWSALAWALTVGPRQEVGYVAFSSPAFYLIFTVLCLQVRASWLVWGWAALETIAFPCRVLASNRAHQYPIMTRAGLYWTADPNLSRDMNEVHAWMETFCPPGSYVLAYEYFGRLYTLHKVRNPARHTAIVSCYSPEEEFTEAARRLDELQVPFILLRPLSGAGIAQFASRIPAAEFDATFARHWQLIGAHYERIAENGSCSLWRRRK